MRFAYIDSHGNEVPIPSVDALGLRIELGAIRPETELYDAQADRWGPAESHEIFHTLSRDLEGDDFTAPPPPVAPPPPTPEREADPQPGTRRPPEAAAEVHEDVQEEEEEEEEDKSFGLTLAAPPEPVPEPESVPAAPGLDPAPDDPTPSAPEGEGAPPAAAAEGEPDGGFDFGSLDGGLELEPIPLESDPPGPGASAAGLSGLELIEPEPTGRTAMDFGAPGGGAGAGDLELEQPLSEVSPTPMWVEQDGPGAGRDAAMDFTPAPRHEPEQRAGGTAAPAAGVGASGPGAAPPAREPPQRQRSKSRPSRPKRVRVRSVAGPIVSVVVLAAAGVGAYVSWPILSERLGLELEPPRPPVVIPDIPADLVPLMRELGDRALAETFAAVDERTRSPDVPVEPPEEWLFGVYLANASRFEGVPSFWSGMERFMSALRETEVEVFHARYLEAARAEATGDTVRLLTERADSGFVAATAARDDVYRRMDELITAALTLHDFLVANEEGIAYEPAALGVSGDPLLEAVPESDEVRATMWDMLEDLTNALDALGTLDLVSRQELLDILHGRVRNVAIQ